MTKTFCLPLSHHCHRSLYIISLALFLAPSHSIACHWLFLFYVCVRVVLTKAGTYIHKAHISAYTQQHNNLRPLVIRKSPKPVVLTAIEERG